MSTAPIAPRVCHARAAAGRFRSGRGGAARCVRLGASSSGRARACRPIRGRGWFRPAGSRRSMPCGGGPGSMRRWASWPSGSIRAAATAVEPDEEGVEDDRLRLIFTCCHPALSPEAQVALTLREVCGLTTEEIASAFLVAPATLAQRIVRAKSKIRDAGIPYRGAVARRSAGAARGGAAGDLSRVQRRLRGVVGRVADAARSFGRSDSAGAAAGRTAARAGSRSGCWR